MEEQPVPRIHAVKTVSAKSIPPKSSPSEVLRSADDIFPVLNPGGYIHLDDGEKPIPENKKQDNCKLWLCLDSKSKSTVDNKRIFVQGRHLDKSHFEATVDVQRYKSGSRFIQVEAEEDWRIFKITKTFDRSKDSPVKPPKESQKRQRGEAATVEVAQQLFNTLRNLAGNDENVTFTIAEGGIRDKITCLPKVNKYGHFWLTLDYKGTNLYQEDIITFNSSTTTEAGPAFKAFITSGKASAEHQGKLVLKITAEPQGQFQTFKLQYLHGTANPISEEAESPLQQEDAAEIIEEEDNGDIQPMDDEDDFGLLQLVKDKISTGVKKLKGDLAQQTTALENERNRYSELEKQFQQHQELAKLETNNFKVKLQGLELQIQLARNDAKETEARYALLAKAPGNPISVDASVQKERDDLLAEVSRLNEIKARYSDSLEKSEYRVRELEKLLERFHAKTRQEVIDEARQDIRKWLEKQLALDAYVEILNSNPLIRRMVHTDMMDALAAEEKAKPSDCQQVD